MAQHKELFKAINQNRVGVEFVECDSSNRIHVKLDQARTKIMSNNNNNKKHEMNARMIQCEQESEKGTTII